MFVRYVYTADELCLRLSHADTKVVCDTKTCTRGPKDYLNTFIIVAIMYIFVLVDNLIVF